MTSRGAPTPSEDSTRSSVSVASPVILAGKPVGAASALSGCSATTDSRCSSQSGVSTGRECSPGSPGSQPASCASSGRSSAADFVRQRKICVFGSSHSGKTSLVKQYAAGRFSTEHSLTMNRMLSKEYERGGRSFAVHVLDTAGQDELGFFDPQYTIGTDGYVLMYSVTDRESFDVVQHIYRDLWAYVPMVPGIVLVANKVDLAESRVVSRQEGERLAALWGCPYAECSARSASLVGHAFELLLQKIDRSYESTAGGQPAPSAPSAGLSRSSTVRPARARGGCAAQ